jgi:glycerol kinase
MTGLTRGTTRAHLVRAGLEAIGFSTLELLENMLKGSALELPRLRVDGGASANDWLMQFQADLLGVPVERPANVETTALGAAALAGLAQGVWSTLDEFGGTRESIVFEPRSTPEQRRAMLSGWHRAVDAALHWARTPPG